ncbi:MAG: hypothetical protein RLZZ216_1082 [Cyanobacteriota bacterium]|jgi:hypothetical protein
MPKGPPGALIPASSPAVPLGQRKSSPRVAVVHGAGEHVPDGPPRSQQPPAAAGWQRPSVKAETST